MMQEVLKGVLDFVVKLLVANGSMVSFCLRRLVFCLIPPNPLLEAPVPGETWQPPAQQAAVQDHIIKALADILLLVPTAPKTMLSELSQRMPFKIVNRAAPCMYFRAVYQLSQMPAGDCIRDGLQAAMVDCLLNIDVEIKWQDIADQQAGSHLAPAADALQCLSSLDLCCKLMQHCLCLPCDSEMYKSPHSILEYPAHLTLPKLGADHVDDEHDSEDEQDVFALEGRTGQELQEQTIQTLDHLLWRCSEAGQLPRTWAVMLAAFDRTLLHTYRSKFTQFLVYYMCQQVKRMPCIHLSVCLQLSCSMHIEFCFVLKGWRLQLYMCRLFTRSDASSQANGTA